MCRLTNGIDVSTGAVVLGEIPSETLVHIGTAQHQEEATPAGVLNHIC